MPGPGAYPPNSALGNSDGNWIALPWSQLSAVGNVSVLKFSYLSVVAIPVMATVVEWLNAIPKLAAWHLTPLSLSWPPALFFFGSVVLALATLLQEIGCPPLIKSFRSAADWRRSAFHERQLDDAIERRLCALDHAELRPQLGELAAKLRYELPDGVLDQLADGVERGIDKTMRGVGADRERELASASAEWNAENRRAPGLRALITWLYYSSAAIAIVCLMYVPSVRVWHNFVLVERPINKVVDQFEPRPKGFVCQLNAGLGGASGLAEKGDVVLHCSVLP